MATDTHKAILTAARIFAAGGRITVATRSFWADYDFPAIDVRKDILGAAKAINKVANDLDVGGISGTLADLYSQEDIPTGDYGGGPLGTAEAHVYIDVPFESLTREGDVEKRTINYRRSAFTVPWHTTIDQLEIIVQQKANALGNKYRLGRLMADQIEHHVY